MLDVETSCGRLTVTEINVRVKVNRATSLTDHPEQVFGSVYRTHLLLRPDFNARSGDESFPDLCILWSFETIQEVCAQ